MFLLSFGLAAMKEEFCCNAERHSHDVFYVVIYEL